MRADGGRDIDFRPPPGLGGHTERILLGAGYTAAEIDAFRNAGIVQRAPIK